MDGGSTTEVQFTTILLTLLANQAVPQVGGTLYGLKIVRVEIIPDPIPGGVRLAACILERR